MQNYHIKICFNLPYFTTNNVFFQFALILYYSKDLVQLGKGIAVVGKAPMIETVWVAGDHPKKSSPETLWASLQNCSIRLRMPGNQNREMTRMRRYTVITRVNHWFLLFPFFPRVFKSALHKKKLLTFSNSHFFGQKVKSFFFFFDFITYVFELVT